jgi:hypothetical protein
LGVHAEPTTQSDRSGTLISRYSQVTAMRMTVCVLSLKLFGCGRSDYLVL